MQFQDIIILEEDEGLLLRAREGFEDTCEEKMVERQAGDKWMVYGPLDFIPPIQVEVSIFIWTPLFVLIF